MEALRIKLLLLVAFLAAAPHILAVHIADFDEVWQKRAEKGRKAALDAYQQNPENITNELNHFVHEDMERERCKEEIGQKGGWPLHSHRQASDRSIAIIDPLQCFGRHMACCFPNPCHPCVIKVMCTTSGRISRSRMSMIRHISLGQHARNGGPGPNILDQMVAFLSERLVSCSCND